MNQIENIIMNPIRQRIIQYLLLEKKGTVNDIHKKLTDVPIASLYRHIKVLLEAEVIYVISEEKIRSVIEKTYSLKESSSVKDNNYIEMNQLVQSTLLYIMTSFQRYFISENIDPTKDMINLTTSTLMLSESEFTEILTKIGKIISKYIKNEPREDRKSRSFTIISSPNEEEN